MKRMSKPPIYILSIHLVNFEGHKNSFIPLSPGTNVFVGETDHGKSTVIRAFIWVTDNRPGAEAVRRTGSEETVVTITSTRGIVTRKRSNTENQYIINKGKPLSGVGRSVPSEVFEILGIDSSINIQKQFDSPFLLSLNPGQVSKVLNEAVRLESMAKTVGNLNAGQRDAKNQLKMCKKALAEKLDEKAALSWTVDAGQRLHFLSKDIGVYESLMNRSERINTLLPEVIKNKNAILHYQERIDQLAPVFDLKKELLQVQELYDRSESIQEICEELSHIDSKLENAKTVTFDAQPLLKQAEDLANIRSKRLQILELIDSLQDNTEKIRTVTSRYNRSHKELDKIAPDMCPLCGNETKGSASYVN